MFNKSKCPRCNSGISKKFDFCPYCGKDLNSNSGDYGFLGKNDLEDIKLPMGFNMMLKPLMKELTRQMNELDKELKKDSSKEYKPRANFSITFGTPGSKPIKINSVTPIKTNATNTNQKLLALPKVSPDVLSKIKELKKKNPETHVRRLSDRMIYELDLPGVDHIRNVNITNLENAIEVKAFSKDNFYIKDIEVDFPLLSYSFDSEKLVLEFGLGNRKAL